MVRPSRRGVADPSSPRPSGADFTHRDTSKGLQRGGSTSARQTRKVRPILTWGKAVAIPQIRDRRPGRPSSCSAARPGVHNGQVTKRGRRWGYSDERVSVKKQSRKKDAGAVLCRRATCSISRETSCGGGMCTLTRARATGSVITRYAVFFVPMLLAFAAEKGGGAAEAESDRA